MTAGRRKSSAPHRDLATVQANEWAVGQKIQAILRRLCEPLRDDPLYPLMCKVLERSIHNKATEMLEDLATIEEQARVLCQPLRGDPRYAVVLGKVQYLIWYHKVDGLGLGEEVSDG